MDAGSAVPFVSGDRRVGGLAWPGVPDRHFGEGSPGRYVRVFGGIQRSPPCNPAVIGTQRRPAWAIPIGHSAWVTPIIRAKTGTGATWGDPSEDLLYELLLDIDRGDEEFFIIERLADPSGHTYVQVIKDDGDWIVECREGGPASHFRSRVPDIRDAHRALVFWAHGGLLGARPGTADGPDLAWDRLQF
jgi:hypothetical protein